MALEGYKSNNNVVYSSKYHCVWTPKYRRSVLVGAVATRCEAVIRQVAEKYSAEIIAIEIMPDHVHVLVEVGIRILVASGYVETLNDCGQCVSLAKVSNTG